MLKLSIYAAEQPERTRQKLVPERVGTALSRSQRSLKRKGLALKGVDTGTPTGRLFLNIVGSFAEFERGRGRGSPRPEVARPIARHPADVARHRGRHDPGMSHDNSGMRRVGQIFD